MKDCIFCKIVNGEIPTAKIYEDKRFIAILDAFPAVKAQFLVMPKEHVTSKFTEMPDHVLADGMLVAKKVAEHVDFKLKTRSCVVIEGFGVSHMHIRVHPMEKGATSIKIEPTVKAEDLKSLAETLRM